ncbi:phosphonate C-P lyase system protein PhnH [Elioraea rosea]|uniref:phosphonate C-P lyase system protein PhnH n=1 Tax=Elioraea rosea TaxID=2492390 RepID=UPI001EF663AA|nr:phosphonate C-P lyase system protein PhnH [Elioraea rosea]
MSEASLSPGFAHPVRDAQAAFRALLEAAARPGTIASLRVPAEPPPCLPPAMAAVALTLVDADTPLWIDAAAHEAAVWLRFHCGCRIVADAREAGFVFAADASALPDMATLDAGRDEYPDRGATIVLAVAGFGSGAALRLTGPGIDGERVVSVEGLAAGFVAARAANHRLFPRGVDAILVSGAHAMFLPRSTSIEEA